MAQETWEEVRYHVLGQLPILNKKIDDLSDQVSDIDKRFEKSMAVLTTKMMIVMAIGSGAIGILVQVITHYMGVG